MNDTFDNYFFTSNASSFTCPGFPWQCEPTTCACARDPTGKRYSCDFAKPCITPPCFADVCWSGSTPCKTDGSTFDCGDGSNSWCCRYEKEVCTQNLGQINMCWSSAHDTLTNISIKSLNSLYRSLSSAKPSASSYTFEPLALIAATATTSASSRSASGSSVLSGTNFTGFPTISSSASASATPSQSSSISGAAIVGIVIGVVVAFVFLAGGFYMFARRKRQKIAGNQEGTYEADAKEVQELPGEERSELPAAKPPTLELQGSCLEYPIMPGTEPQELPADSYGRVQ